MLYALGNERKVQYRKKTVVKNVAHSPPQDSQEVFFMDTFFDPFCFELAWENWAKSFLSHSVWGHDLDHTHSFARFRWSGLTNQQTLNCMPEMVSLQWERTQKSGFSTPNCILARREMVQSVQTRPCYGYADSFPHPFCYCNKTNCANW